jgi:hypothetical protein
VTHTAALASLFEAQATTAISPAHILQQAIASVPSPYANAQVT